MVRPPRRGGRVDVGSPPCRPPRVAASRGRPDSPQLTPPRHCVARRPVRRCPPAPAVSNRPPPPAPPLAALGKPPSFVQVSLTTTAMSFAGTTAPTAYVSLTSLGKVEEAAPVASRALAELLTAHLGVEPGRACTLATTLLEGGGERQGGPEKGGGGGGRDGRGGVVCRLPPPLRCGGCHARHRWGAATAGRGGTPKRSY